MKRYLDKDKLLRELSFYSYSDGSIKRAISIIDEFPTEEVVPVIHAHWIDCNGKPVELDSNGYTKVQSLGLWCSHCHEWLVPSDEYIVVGRYCPNCGSKMDRKA